MTDQIFKCAMRQREQRYLGTLGYTSNATTRSRRERRCKAKILGAAFTLIFLSGCAVPVTEQAFNISGFKPIYPQQMAVVSFTTTNVYSVFIEVDSTQPELAWIPFPGVHEVSNFGFSVRDDPFVEADLSKVSNVTYEIKICEVTADKDPWAIDLSDIALAYERVGIPENKHKVEQPLKPGTRYVWSIRSRFDLNGQPRLSEWTAINSLGGRFLNAGRRAVREFGRIHPMVALRFKTPGSPPASSPKTISISPDPVCGDKMLEE